MHGGPEARHNDLGLLLREHFVVVGVDLGAESEVGVHLVGGLLVDVGQRDDLATLVGHEAGNVLAARPPHPMRATR